MRMDELAQPALDAVRDGRVRFHPELLGRLVYLDWMENIRPWCVSRQLWWGHRLSGLLLRRLRARPTSRASRRSACGACGGPLRQDEDVLDTWFSSALWPFATLGWPEQTDALRAFYPTDVVVNGARDHLLWVARMIMMGLEFAGDIPFSDVYVHAVIQAPDGRRMSKSLGTGIDPLKEIDRTGADAVRFGMLAMSSTQDVRYSAEKIEQGERLANKLFNAARFVILGIGERGGEAAPRPSAIEDRWILSRLGRFEQELAERIAAYDFPRLALALYDFVYGELCDWYIELVKPRLGEPDLDATLRHVLRRTLLLAHPVMPFVTEELWRYVREDGEGLLAGMTRGSAEPRVDEDAEAALEPRDGGDAGDPQLARAGRRQTGRAACRAHRGGGLRGRDRAAAGAHRASAARGGGRGRRARGDPRWCRRGPRGRRSRRSHTASGARTDPPRRRDRAPARKARKRRLRPERPARGGRARAGEAGGARGRARGSPVTLPEPREDWSAEEAERWLLARERFGMRFGLDRMHRLLNVLGLPRVSYPTVHVVGTNGKSSTTRMIAALLAREGLRAGCYTSPHLLSYRERMQIDGVEIAPGRFAKAIARVVHASELVDRTAADEGDVVTQFELLTAAALCEFEGAAVDVAVLEAGLGGRFDATNVVDSRVAVLTNVGLEHTRYLGPTVADIAREKLDVVRRDSKLVVGAGIEADALALARETAAERGAALLLAPEDVTVELRAGGGYQRRIRGGARRGGSIPGARPRCGRCGRGRWCDRRARALPGA